MPRFYFHVRSGDETQHDREGLELKDLDAAKMVAMRYLGDFTRRLQEGGQITIGASDENKIPVFQATLKIETKELG